MILKAVNVSVRVRYQIVNETTVWKRNVISYKRGREHNLKYGDIESLIFWKGWRCPVSLTLGSSLKQLSGLQSSQARHS